VSDRILFLSNGSICYDSTTYFIQCIGEELKAMGWEVMHIRLDKATQKDKLCVLADEYDSQPFDYVFDINTKLDAVCDDSGRYCFDRLGKAVWHYILDHPFYHHDSLKVPLKNMNVICLDEMHKKFIDETYPHINSCIVLPLAAKQAGIKEVLVPKENSRDVDEMETEILEGIILQYVHCVEDVLKEALA